MSPRSVRPTKRQIRDTFAWYEQAKCKPYRVGDEHPAAELFSNAELFAPCGNFDDKGGER